jgi:CRP/FNR family transcriptional regulator, cyclic AMP receptor protein
VPGAPIDVLRRVPLFAGLADRDLERLADRFQQRSFPEGAVVLEEGSTGTSFFIIEAGQAEVATGGMMRATLQGGDYFGEIAIFDEGVRSASVTAASDLRTHFLTPWDFRPLVEEHPDLAWKFLQNLARRLRAAQAPPA